MATSHSKGFVLFFAGLFIRYNAERVLPRIESPFRVPWQSRHLSCHFTHTVRCSRGTCSICCAQWSVGSLSYYCLSWTHSLVGLVVRRPPRERKIPGSNPACAGIFSGSSHSSDLKIGTPVATLPGAWRSAGCQYTVAGWGRMLDLQLLSQCGST